MKAAWPTILMSVGALIVLAVPGTAIVRNMRTAGAAERAVADGDLALLAWASILAVPVGLMLMIAGFIIRRARKVEEQVAAQRKARREAAHAARRAHRLD